MKQEFLEIYKKYITRPGSEELLAYLEKSDFFRAPASHKYHLSIPGGLVMHSVGVYKRLRKLYILEKILKGESAELTPEQEETIAICGLLHDLCKIDFYQYVKKSRKTGRTLPNGKPLSGRITSDTTSRKSSYTATARRACTSLPVSCG